jgi:hypothetical protein
MIIKTTICNMKLLFNSVQNKGEIVSLYRHCIIMRKNYKIHTFTTGLATLFKLNCYTYWFCHGLP